MKKPGIMIGILVLMAFYMPAQAQDADALLKAVGANLDKISRFEADALIKVDVEFINIKDRKVKVKFESPD